MGNTLAGWQDSYYCVGTTAITESPSFSSSTCVGSYGEGNPQLFTLNHPEFDAGLQIIESEKATKFSYTVKGNNTYLERTVGALFPESPLETTLDNLSAFLPLLTLLQTPATGFISENVKVFVPYKTSAPFWYASLLRTTEEGYSYKIIGAIAKTVTIRGTEGEEIRIETTWAGADISTGESISVSPWVTSACKEPLLFQNLTCAYESTSQTIDLQEFEIVITNNAIHPTYNSRKVQRHVLGNLEISGTLKVPWSSTVGGQNEFINRLLAGDNFLVYLWWGNQTPSQEGDFSIVMNIEADEASLSGNEDEDVNEISFVGVYDGINEPIKIMSYFGEVYPSQDNFNVLNYSGVNFVCRNGIYNLDGIKYVVSKIVLSENGTHFTVL